MAMVIKNNSAAQLALGELNKNNNKLSKSLQKVSSGMKLDGAEDGASEYAISEKMRVRLRGLNQDIVNAQTGSNLVRVAEGGIQDIIDNLRDMKAMAIKAANDHNTDADRATIQKEFEQRKAEIDDIASTTNYNGKILLDGRYEEPTVKVIPGSLTVTNTFLGYVTMKNNSNSAVEQYVSTFSTVLPPTHASLVYSWGNDMIEGQQGNFGSHSIAIIGCPGAILGRTGADMKGVSFPNDLNQQGFFLVCRDCDDITNIVFDSNTTASTYSDSISGQSNIHQYTIGIQGVTDIPTLNAAVFNGIANASGKPTSPNDTANNVVVSNVHDLRIIHGSFALSEPDDPVAAAHVAGFDNHPRISSGYYFTKAGATSDYQSWIGAYGKGVVTEISSTPMEIPEQIEYDLKNPLTIHTDTKANENLKVYINDMRTESMGLSEVKVIPREAAVAALSSIDNAVSYALNENTRMGAYQSRLNFTIDNLTIASENTQASESVIRDADMAKSMTEYTKNNVLAQAAQSMLAQANQTAGSVLSLLQ